MNVLSLFSCNTTQRSDPYTYCTAVDDYTELIPDAPNQNPDDRFLSNALIISIGGLPNHVPQPKSDFVQATDNYRRGGGQLRFTSSSLSIEIPAGPLVSSCLEMHTLCLWLAGG